MNHRPTRNEISAVRAAHFRHVGRRGLQKARAALEAAKKGQEK